MKLINILNILVLATILANVSNAENKISCYLTNESNFGRQCQGNVCPTIDQCISKIKPLTNTLEILVYDGVHLCNQQAAIHINNTVNIIIKPEDEGNTPIFSCNEINSFLLLNTNVDLKVNVSNLDFKTESNSCSSNVISLSGYSYSQRISAINLNNVRFINFNSTSGLIYVHADSLTLNNVKILNAVGPKYNYLISSNTNNLNVVNSKFSNCSCYTIIDFVGTYLSISNSEFVENSLYSSGVSLNTESASIKSNNFSNNKILSGALVSAATTFLSLDQNNFNQNNLMHAPVFYLQNAISIGYYLTNNNFTNNALLSYSTVFLSKQGYYYLTGSVFSNNTGPMSDSGDLYFPPSETVYLYGGTFIANKDETYKHHLNRVLPSYSDDMISSTINQGFSSTPCPYNYVTMQGYYGSRTCIEINYYYSSESGDSGEKHHVVASIVSAVIIGVVALISIVSAIVIGIRKD